MNKRNIFWEIILFTSILTAHDYLMLHTACDEAASLDGDAGISHFANYGKIAINIFFFRESMI